LLRGNLIFLDLLLPFSGIAWELLRHRKGLAGESERKLRFTGTKQLGIRGGIAGVNRPRSRLFQFDPRGNVIREIGQNANGFGFTDGLRIDTQDNIRVVDEGSNRVIEFNPQGLMVMTMGRKAENNRIPQPEPCSSFTACPRSRQRPGLRFQAMECMAIT
jgi:hypothetical protein